MVGNVKVSWDDFKRFVEFLEKEGQPGAYIAFELGQNAAILTIKTKDKVGDDITIELSDSDYPFKPRVIRTETL